MHYKTYHVAVEARIANVNVKVTETIVAIVAIRVTRTFIVFIVVRITGAIVVVEVVESVETSCKYLELDENMSI